MARFKKSDIDKRTDKAGAESPASAEDRKLLDRVQKWHSESRATKSQCEERQAKNIKLMRGIFTEDENANSNVRKRKKTFHRKIWAIAWRLIASAYQTFLRDQDTFKIEGRDTINDWHKAGVLQSLVEYRRDQMLRHKDLFVKQVWAVYDILQMRWVS